MKTVILFIIASILLIATTALYMNMDRWEEDLEYKFSKNPYIKNIYKALMMFTLGIGLVVLLLSNMHVAFYCMSILVSLIIIGFVNDDYEKKKAKHNMNKDEIIFVKECYTIMLKSYIASAVIQIIFMQCIHRH